MGLAYLSGPRVRDGLTEYDTSHGTEHEHQGDSPCYLRILLAELLAQLGHGEGDGEEVEGVPGPSQEANEEEHPLLHVEQGQKLERVRGLVHRRLQCWGSGCKVPPHPHLLRVCRLVHGRVIAQVAHLVAEVVVLVGHVWRPLKQ